MDGIVATLTVLAVLGSGLMAGVFFAFDTAVMPALRRQPKPSGTATMNTINLVIVNPVFLLLFTGTALICAALVVLAFLSDEPHAAWRVAGAAIYLVGSFVVTAAVNIPLNNRLADVGPADPDAEAAWDDYLSRWTAWNHVRTVSSLAAAVLLAAAAAS